MNLTKGKKTFQISATGSLVIRECSDDGRCLTIENTGTKVMTLSCMLVLYLSSAWKNLRL